MEGQESAAADFSAAPDEHQTASDEATVDSDTAHSPSDQTQFSHHPSCLHSHSNSHAFLIVELSKTQVFCMIGVISTLVLAASIGLAVFLNYPSHFNGDPMVSIYINIYKYTQ